MKKHIRIENPAGGMGTVPAHRAKRYVASGRAQWEIYGVSIWLNESDHRTCSAVRTVADMGYDRASAGGLASQKAIRGLPVAGDVVKVVMLRSRRSKKAA